MRTSGYVISSLLSKPIIHISVLKLDVYIRNMNTKYYNPRFSYQY